MTLSGTNIDHQKGRPAPPNPVKSGRFRTTAVCARATEGETAVHPRNAGEHSRQSDGTEQFPIQNGHHWPFKKVTGRYTNDSAERHGQRLVPLMYASFRVNPGGGDVWRTTISLKKSEHLYGTTAARLVSALPKPERTCTAFYGHFADTVSQASSPTLRPATGSPHAHFLRLQVGMPNRIERFQKQRKRKPARQSMSTAKHFAYRPGVAKVRR